MADPTDLATAIARHTIVEGVVETALPRLSLIRLDHPTRPTPSVLDALLCVIAQGSKRVRVGDRDVFYDAAHNLLASIDLPLDGHIVQASPAAPYLSCKLSLDQAVLAELILADGGGARTSDLPVIAAYPNDPDLVDAVWRLIRLLDEPARMSTLAPLVEREILYRLLTGLQGPLLRQMAAPDSHLAQIGRAVAQIRRRLHDQLRIEEVAAAAGMSPSSLHAHFKAITRMTPLEYQKQLRLQEARRLMLTEGTTAGAAGFAVGYGSPSQFSREYRRLFGAPPRQDVADLQIAHVEEETASVF